MLRIAICDDEIRARDTLWLALENILHEGSEEVVYDFSSGTNAVNWLRKHPGEIDLLFLDVEMDGLNGMDTARQIREFDDKLMIVFITGYADYVFDGYSVGAMDYLMKPVKADKLQSVIGRVREKLFQDADDTYVIKNMEGTYRFSYKDILYFYSERRKVILVTKDGEYSFYDKLDTVEEKLEADFVRIHQRYLVNPEKVEHIGSNFVMIHGEKLPISRAARETAIKKLTKAMLGEII